MVSLLIVGSMQGPKNFAKYTEYIDTLAEPSLVTTDSGQTSGPNSYKHGYTFLESI